MRPAIAMASQELWLAQADSLLGNLTNKNEEEDPLYTIEAGGVPRRQPLRRTRCLKTTLGAFFLLSVAGGVATYFTMKDSPSSSQTAAAAQQDDSNFEFLPTPSEVSEGTRIFARYNGDQGHNLARKCATNIIQDKDEDDIIIFEASKDCMKELQDDNDILEAEIDNPVYALSSSLPGLERDLSEIIPWGLKAIQADQLETGPNEIVICVVDSGIALNHPDLNKARITGTDTTKFYGPVWSWNSDKSSHGTHVAGTIAALSDNDSGVRGAGSFRLHIARALGDDGRGYESDIRTAVEHCVAAGANIINLSLGGRYVSYHSNKYYKEVVQELGILMIAAAGNDGNKAMVYPAAHPDVISVGAVYEVGAHWPGSNTNDQLEFSAPGHNIMSTTVSASAVKTDDFSYTASQITGAAVTSISGKLAYCEENDEECEDAKNRICLMIKDNTSIKQMLQNCQDSDGIGAIIFHPTGNSGMQNWSAQGITIPAVAVKKDSGIQLLEKIGKTVTIGDSDNDKIEYTYDNLMGTSMASPHVAAAAALVWSHYPNCSNHQIRYALAMTAHNPQGNCDDHYGYGVVKAKDAYDWLSKNDCGDWDVPQVSQGGCTTLLD